MEGFSSLLRMKGSLGSSQKRSRLIWSWFGLNAASAMIRWSRTVVCIAYLNNTSPFCPSLWFVPSLRLRKTGDTTSVVQGAHLVAVHGITLCVTYGELAQGLGWDVSAGCVCGLGLCLGDI